MKHWLDIAIIAGKKNLDGRLVLEVEPAFHSCIQEGIDLWVVPPSIDVPRHLSLSAVHSHSNDSFIVSFSEIADVSTADQMIGKHCLIDSERVRGVMISDADAEEHALMIVGYEVIDADKDLIGEVVSIIDRAMQPLLVVSHDEADEVLIPFVEDYIIDIDDDTMTITMDLPRGLLEL